MVRSLASRDWVLMTSRRLQKYATFARILLDILAWCAATATAIYLRFGLTFDKTATSGLFKVLPMVAVLQVLVGTAVGLYRRKWRYGSFDEVAALVVASILTSTLLFVLNGYYFKVRPIPQSAVIVGGVLGLVLMAGCRYVWRLTLEQARRPDDRSAERLLVYGAGEGGIQVLTALLRSRTSPYVPVGLLDDDPAKRHLYDHGRPGPRRPDACPAGGRAQRPGHGADHRRARRPTAQLVRELAELAARGRDSTCKVAAAGRRAARAAGRASATSATSPRPTCSAATRSRPTSTRSPATSTGQAGAGHRRRRLDRLGAVPADRSASRPAELIMLDRDESRAARRAAVDRGPGAARHARPGPGRHPRPPTRIAASSPSAGPRSCSTPPRSSTCRCSSSIPARRCKTNVSGTLNVLEAAAAAGVDGFVNISTDKAANPISVLGYSKRIAERLTAARRQRPTRGHATSACGSATCSAAAGSVLTAFRAQIAAGRPDHRHPPRRHPLLHDRPGGGAARHPGRRHRPRRRGAGARHGRAGAHRRRRPPAGGAAERPRRDRLHRPAPGEKLHEELFGDGELDHRPRHPLISHAPVPPLAFDEVTGAKTLWWEWRLGHEDLAAESLESLEWPPAVSTSNSPNRGICQCPRSSRRWSSAGTRSSGHCRKNEYQGVTISCCIA